MVPCKLEDAVSYRKAVKAHMSELIEALGTRMDKGLSGESNVTDEMIVATMAKGIPAHVWEMSSLALLLFELFHEMNERGISFNQMIMVADDTLGDIKRELDKETES